MKWPLVGVGLLALGCGVTNLRNPGNARPRADFRPLAAACLALETSPRLAAPKIEADHWREIDERLDRVLRNLQSMSADLERAMK